MCQWHTASAGRAKGETLERSERKSPGPAQRDRVLLESQRKRPSGPTASQRGSKIDIGNPGADFAPGFLYALHRNGQQNICSLQRREVVCLEHIEKKLEELGREELLEYLRQLAEWKNNDVVKLAFLEDKEAEQVDSLDLTGVSELKRNANGTFEAKFVDRVRVLTMLRELLDERRDGALGDFLDGLYQPADGDAG